MKRLTTRKNNTKKLVHNTKKPVKNKIRASTQIEGLKLAKFEEIRGWKLSVKMNMA